MQLQRADFFADLRFRMAEHLAIIAERLAPHPDALLAQAPAANEWSVFACIEHLNLTHDYYWPKITTAVAERRPPPPNEHYQPTGWGGFYMAFALNPRLTFPSPPSTTPQTQAHDRTIFQTFIAYQGRLARLLADSADAALATPISIEDRVRFSLGDCLKIVVYHDRLHLDQAQRALASLGR